MKIIRTDNFDRETVSDKLIATTDNSYYASLIARLLNEKQGVYRQHYYKAVEDDYQLYEYEP